MLPFVPCLMPLASLALLIPSVLASHFLGFTSLADVNLLYFCRLSQSSSRTSHPLIWAAMTSFTILTSMCVLEIPLSKVGFPSFRTGSSRVATHTDRYSPLGLLLGAGNNHLVIGGLNRPHDIINLFLVIRDLDIW